MWVDELISLCVRPERTIPGAFLKGTVAFTMAGEKLGTGTLDRASGCLLDRFCVQPGRAPRRLVLLRHNCTPAASEYLVGALLVMDLLHSRGQEFGVSLPANELGRLLSGDVLVVTQRVADFVGFLRRLDIGGVRLSDMWSVQALTKYVNSPGCGPRVFVANPGWIRRTPHLDDRFCATLIDATHPRTLVLASGILAQLSEVRLQTVVCPPLDQRRIESLCGAGKDREAVVWLWDPDSERALADALRSPSAPQAPHPTRTYLVCDDSSINDALKEIHDTLRECYPVDQNGVAGGLFEAWAIYHRLRQTAVSLLELEEAHARARSVFQLPLRKRLDRLRDEDPGPSARIRAHWPHLIQQLAAAYELLLERREPPKFWVLANYVAQIAELDEGQVHAIVVPTEQDATVLTSMLVSLIDEAAPMLEHGKLFLLTVKQEPIFLHRGYSFRAVLPGYRTYGSRYLDIFPPQGTVLITYPYEVMVDERIQAAMRHTVAIHIGEEQRIAALKQIGLPMGASPRDLRPRDTPGTARAPKTVIIDGLGREPLRIVRSPSVDDLALDELIERSAPDAWTGEVTTGAPEVGVAHGGSAFPIIELVFCSGDRLRLPLGCKLDVYYPASEELARVEVERLQRGDQVVLFVDDPLAQLYHRFVEAIREKKDARTNAVLELWGRAKELLLRRHPGEMSQLHTSLRTRGLSVTCQALRAWFKEGEQETIAPQLFDDFALLAEETGVYRDSGLLRETFTIIQEERVLHRIAGKRLRALLRALVTPDYDLARTAADTLGTGVDQLGAAISIEEVESVTA